MMDLSETIQAKSDQLNADDLVGGPMTITIQDITADPGDQQQPIAIHYGDPNKTFKPCKSMRRVLVNIWGKDGKAFIGRSLTLYRDPSVTWGGVAVGGIRISHMSDITSSQTLVMAKSKHKREPYKIQPLVIEQPKPAATFETIANIFSTHTVDAINYLYQIGWLKEGQTPKDLNQEQIERIAANPDGFVEQFTTKQEGQ